MAKLDLYSVCMGALTGCFGIWMNKEAKTDRGLNDSSIIGPIASLAGTWLNGKVETKAAETKAKVAKAEAEAQIMLSGQPVKQTGKRLWLKVSVSWKDEWLTILFSIPLILVFTGDWGREVVQNGFVALDSMPQWYQYTLGVIVAASLWCYVQLLRFFGKSNGI